MGPCGAPVDTVYVAIGCTENIGRGKHPGDIECFVSHTMRLVTEGSTEEAASLTQAAVLKTWCYPPLDEVGQFLPVGEQHWLMETLAVCTSRLWMWASELQNRRIVFTRVLTKRSGEYFSTHFSDKHFTMVKLE